MRSLECGACAERLRDRYPKLREAGSGETVLLYPASMEGPAEFGRMVSGTVIRSGYRCDSCNAPLHTGEEVAGFTAWRSGRAVPRWEAVIIREVCG